MTLRTRQRGRRPSPELGVGPEKGAQPDDCGRAAPDHGGVACKSDEVSHFPIPPTTLAAGLAAQHLVARRRAMTPTSAAAAALIVVASGVLAIGSLREFRRQRTTFDPVDVSAATALVVQGSNHVTRNPMYVGMAGLLVAQAIARRSAMALLPAAAFVVVMDRVQIPVEETALSAAFRNEYEQYRRSTPRWLAVGHSQSRKV